MYKLFSSIIDGIVIEQIESETYRFIQDQYTHDNLKTHAAYLADKAKNRTSYGFAICNALPSDLPHVSFSRGDYPILFDTQTKIMRDYMGLFPGGRVLFNIQIYWKDFESVPVHHDGELFEFSRDANGGLIIDNSLRPDTVAVFTLVNKTDTGTRLHYGNGRDVTVCGRPGDLLVFNNLRLWHSVGNTRPPEFDGFSESPIRLTIGWRSLHERCHHWLSNGGYMPRPLLVSEADELYRVWYNTRWSEIWENTGRAAF